MSIGISGRQQAFMLGGLSSRLWPRAGGAQAHLRQLRQLRWRSGQRVQRREAEAHGGHVRRAALPDPNNLSW